MLVKFITGFILGLSLYSCNFQKPEALSGHVMSVVNDEHLSRAIVTVMTGKKIIAKTVTDENGYFEVKGLPSGTYDVIAEKRGFGKMKIDSMNVKRGNEVVTHFMLIPFS